MTIIDQYFQSRIQEEVNFEGQNMSIEIIAHERNDSCIEQMLEETSVKKLENIVTLLQNYVFGMKTIHAFKQYGDLNINSKISTADKCKCRSVHLIQRTPYNECMRYKQLDFKCVKRTGFYVKRKN